MGLVDKVVKTFAAVGIASSVATADIANAAEYRRSGFPVPDLRRAVHYPKMDGYHDLLDDILGAESFVQVFGIRVRDLSSQYRTEYGISSRNPNQMVFINIASINGRDYMIAIDNNGEPPMEFNINDIKGHGSFQVKQRFSEDYMPPPWVIGIAASY